MHYRIPFILTLFICCNLTNAITYYVSPKGDDASLGTSPDHPWKTCAKVNDAKFIPGDTILFARGGEWRDHLQSSSSGEAGKPITYDAYGNGAKPKFLGSDLLENTKFAPAGDNKYSYAIGTQADSALCDHVFIPSTWASGTLTITTTSDPHSDGKVYTACLRGNVLFSNRKNHLVFRNLIVDETAGQLNEGINQGYGIRIEGSTDVLVESCEAYRCGRHNIAVINSTEFVGRHLLSAYVVPKMPGDNTAYVSYADANAPVAKCTSVWDDIKADHMDDGKGGQYLTFVSHGDNQGLITLENSELTNKASFMSAPVIVKHTTLKQNASIENFGKGLLIDSVTLLDSSAIDQWGSDGTIQNCVAKLTPTGGGPTGYGSAIVLRDKANLNVIRFNTLVTGRFSCLEVAGENSVTSCYGNIMIADGSTLAKGSGTLRATDIAFTDYNFFSPTATFSGKSLADWQAMGFDRHSLAGNPEFDTATPNSFELKPGSPCIAAAKVAAQNVPPLDFAGQKRPPTAPSIGAFEGPAAH
jgi:hypothetical protein